MIYFGLLIPLLIIVFSFTMVLIVPKNQSNVFAYKNNLTIEHSEFYIPSHRRFYALLGIAYLFILVFSTGVLCFIGNNSIGIILWDVIEITLLLPICIIASKKTLSFFKNYTK